MFDRAARFVAQVIEPEAVLGRFNLLAKLRFQRRPLGRVHQAFENGVLNLMGASRWLAANAAPAATMSVEIVLLYFISPPFGIHKQVRPSPRNRIFRRVRNPTQSRHRRERSSSVEPSRLARWGRRFRLPRERSSPTRLSRIRVGCLVTGLTSQEDIGDSGGRLGDYGPLISPDSD